MRLTLLALATMIFFQTSSAAFAETAGERVARESMIKAQAEKERNDAIVQRQRDAEKARKESERLDQACKRARTC